MVEAIGMVGTVILLLSMLCKNVLWLRVLNVVGSIIYIVYAALIPAYSTLIMNIAMVVINIVYISLIVKERIANNRKLKQKMKEDKEK